MGKTSSLTIKVDKRLLLLGKLKPPTTIALVGGDASHRREQAGRLAELLVKDRDGRVARGAHPDVVTIRDGDPANTASIREQMGFLNFRPFEAARSVFVLEDAGRLEVAASNAMLKTLEEGGGYLVIILEVDSRDELLETIASRCYMVPFGFPPSESTLLPNYFLSTMRAGSLHTIDKLERSMLEDALYESQKVLMAMCENGAVEIEWAATLHAGQVFSVVKFLVQALRDFDEGLHHDLLLCAMDAGMRKEVLNAD